jgi:hypothetical protein
LSFFVGMTPVEMRAGIAGGHVLTISQPIFTESMRFIGLPGCHV